MERIEARGLDMRDANTNDSSGMCKAGFAGDDAPRAVFRKLGHGTPITSESQLTAVQRLSSVGHAIMGTLPPTHPH